MGCRAGSAEIEVAAGRGRACTALAPPRVARASVGRQLLEVGSRVRYYEVMVRKNRSFGVCGYLNA